MAGPEYDDIMRAAVDSILLVAARRTIDTRLIAVDFDLGHGPGPHAIHALTICVRHKPIAVTDDFIPHDWLPATTAFMDARFARLVDALLADLRARALVAGVFL